MKEHKVIIESELAQTLIDIKENSKIKTKEETIKEIANKLHDKYHFMWSFPEDKHKKEMTQTYKSYGI